MPEEEGRATREDDRAPRHWKTLEEDQQQTHPTALPATVQSAARLEDLPSVLGTAELCRVLRTTRYRVRMLTASGQLRRLAYQPHKIQVAKAEVRRFLREQTDAAGAA